MDMHSTHKINPIHECFLNLIRNPITLIDTDGTIHEDGKVNHKILSKTVCLSGIYCLYSWYLASQLMDLYIQSLPGDGVHQVIG